MFTPPLKSAFRILLLLLLVTPAARSADGRTFFIDYSAAPDPARLLACDLAILDPAAKADLKPGQQMGIKYFAYLSLAEARKDAWYLSELKKLGIRLSAPAQPWGTHLVDCTSKAWQSFFVDTLARQAASAGFDGFFLDTADSISQLPAEKPGQDKALRESLVQMVKALRAKYPDREIIINRGFAVLPELFGTVSGVLIESLFQSYDFPARQYREAPAQDTQQLCSWIERIKAAGLPVYAVDYVNPSSPELAAATARRIRDKGCEPFITTPDLKGALLAPLPEVARRVLVVYGWKKGEEKKPVWPADTLAAEILQAPLEWMGYECDYLNAGENAPPEEVQGRYAGIIFDAELEIPFERQMQYAEWLLARKQEGLKVLFAGSFPSQQDDVRKMIFSRFGIRGSGAGVGAGEPCEILKIDRAVMNFEAPVRPLSGDIEDMQAPEEARVFLSVRGSDGSASAVLDPVFAASRGGFLLEPFIAFRPSPEDTLLTFDPFLLLPEIFPSGSFPAPDPTTRDGLRVFLSHVDGDGFTGSTEVEPKAVCAEVIRDRILKAYPFPVTVSVIEAEVRAVDKEALPESRARYEEAARSIFSLPNVQAASHSYAHPYVWMKDDPDYEKLYKELFIPLKDSEGYRSVNCSREVSGSIRYIEKNLLPAGKKVELMLWTGNCRPSAEALALVRQLGIENMNGGDTIISGLHPGIAGVAPRTMPCDGELQIFAPNQNEYVYTNDWSGPFYGGYSRVIEAFEKTESPRRLKPVNIYYHFYSASKKSSLRALEKVYQWAAGQPLHSLTALDYSRSARDSRRTAIFQKGTRSWVLINGGDIRTLRIPKGLGVPDIAASQGITGYALDRSWLYVHTAGRRRTVLTLADNPAAHLFLSSSTGEITFESLGPRQAHFEVRDFRPVAVVLGGAESGSAWEVTINGTAPELKTADAAGHIRLILPQSAEVTVTEQGKQN